MSIPVEYYELIQKDLVSNNKYIDANSIRNVDSMLVEFRKNSIKSD